MFTTLSRVFRTFLALSILAAATACAPAGTANMVNYSYIPSSQNAVFGGGEDLGIQDF